MYQKVIPSLILLCSMILAGCSENGSSDDTPANKEDNVSSTTDTQPPEFDGITHISASDHNEITLIWVEANDNVTPANQLTYLIYNAQTNSLLQTLTGITEYTVTGLQEDTEYSFYITAQDKANNQTVSDLKSIKTFLSSARVDDVELEQVPVEAEVINDTTITVPANTQTNDLQTGQIINGKTTDGKYYLEKVVSIQEENGNLRIESEPVALNEVINTASISSEIDLEPLDNVAANTRSVDGASVRKYVSPTGNLVIEERNLNAPLLHTPVSNSQITRKMDARGFTLSGNKVKFEFDLGSNSSIEGDLEFNPSVRSDVEIAFAQLQSAEFEATGKLNFNIRGDYQFESSDTIRDTKKFYSRSYKVAYPVAGITVYQETELKLTAEYTVQVDSKFHYTALANIESDVEISGVYENGDWDLSASAPIEKTFTHQLESGATVRVQLKLIPSIEVTFYKSLTAYLDLSPYLLSELAIESTPSLYLIENEYMPPLQLNQNDITFGASANGYFDLSIFGLIDLARYPKEKGTTAEFNSWRVPLYGLPNMDTTVTLDPEDGNSLIFQYQYKDYKGQPISSAPFQNSLLVINTEESEEPSVVDITEKWTEDADQVQLIIDDSNGLWSRRITELEIPDQPCDIGGSSDQERHEVQYEEETGICKIQSYDISTGYLTSERQLLNGIYYGLQKYYQDGILSYDQNWNEEGQIINAKIYYPSGAVEYNNTFINGLIATRTSYYESGNLEFTIQFTNGNCIPQTINHYTDSPDSIIYLESDIQCNGADDQLNIFAAQQRERYEDGTLKRELNFSNSLGFPVLHGAYIEYDVNGTKRIEGNYQLGLQSGPWKQFYENGVLAASTTWEISEDGALSYIRGPYEEYYETGIKSVSGEYHNNLRMGLWTEYYENGEKKSSQEWALNDTKTSSKESGAYMEYYESGTLKISGAYDGWTKTGPWTWYHENGAVEATIEGWIRPEGSIFSEYHGEYKKYFDSGALQLQGSYDTGAPIGQWIWAYESGVIMQKGSHLNGERSGTWKYYLSDGRLLEKREHTSTLDYYETNYFSNGYKNSEGRKLNYNKEGIWTYYSLSTGLIRSKSSCIENICTVITTCEGSGEDYICTSH